MLCAARARRRLKLSICCAKRIRSKYQPENDAQYPTSRLGQSLQQIGQLLKANIGVEVLFVDCGGWDNHVNEGGVQGQLSNLLKDLGQGLGRFTKTWATAWRILLLSP